MWLPLKSGKKDQQLSRWITLIGQAEAGTPSWKALDEYGPMMVSTSKFRMSPVSVMEYKGLPRRVRGICAKILHSPTRRQLYGHLLHGNHEAMIFGEWTNWVLRGGKDASPCGETTETQDHRNIHCLKHEQERCHSGSGKGNQRERNWACDRQGDKVVRINCTPHEKYVSFRSSASN